MMTFARTMTRREFQRGGLALGATRRAFPEPPHTHSEIPSGTYTIRSGAVQTSNNSPGSVTINVSDNLAFWGDEVAVKMNLS